jgi:hypothetical protein
MGAFLSISWRQYGMLLIYYKTKPFFVWKVGMMDALLNSCIWDVSSIVQLSLNTEQVLGGQKKRLEAQL